MYVDYAGNEFVIRGGPANDNALDFGNIVVEAGVPMGSSEDQRPIEDRQEHGSLVLNLGGRDAEIVWQQMVRAVTLIGEANIDYNAFFAPQNSNSTIASVLHAVGIDVNDFVPNVPGIDSYPGINNDLLDDYARVFGTEDTSDNDDILNGGHLNDSFMMGSGDDTVRAGQGDDVIEGGDGSDTIDGGDGIDFVSFATSQSGVFADLIDGAGQDGDAEGDTYANVEGVIGSAWADTIIVAESGQVYAAGGDGIDTFYVDSTDTLDDGPTILWGGSGGDSFVFQDVSRGREPLGIMVAEVEGLALENFTEFDVSVLNLGDEIDWSEIDVLLLNPDSGDKFFRGWDDPEDQMGVGTGRYEIMVSWDETHPIDGEGELTGEVYQTGQFQTFYSHEGNYTNYYNSDIQSYASEVVVGDYDVSFLGSRVDTVFGGGARINVTGASAGVDFEGNTNPESEGWYGLLDPATAEFTGVTSSYWEEEDYTSEAEN